MKKIYTTLIIACMALPAIAQVAGTPYIVNCNNNLPRTCLEIKIANPAATDGVYWIDPDGPDCTYGPMQAQCDMTTDGGGWTLVVNYVATTATNATVSRNYLPLIGSSTLGVNESSNSTYWGDANTTLLKVLPFTEARHYFLGRSGAFLAHKKSTSTNLISAIKTGTASTTNPSWIDLPGNITTYTGTFSHAWLFAPYYTCCNPGINCIECCTNIYGYNMHGFIAGGTNDGDNCDGDTPSTVIYRFWVR